MGNYGAEKGENTEQEDTLLDTISKELSSAQSRRKRKKTTSTALALKNTHVSKASKPMSRALAIRGQRPEFVKPEWRAPWKLMRVVSGHLGAVRAVAVDSQNAFFATGSSDRTIKVWDVATGHLKITLTGHHTWGACFGRE